MSDWETWRARDERRRAPKTTISVKLTADELGALDRLRQKVYEWSDTLEARGEVFRRLLREAAPATSRKTKARSPERKTVRPRGSA